MNDHHHESINSDYESNTFTMFEKAARIRGSGRLEERRGCDYDTRGRWRGKGVAWREDEIGWDERRTGVTSNGARLRVLYYSAPSERVIIDETVFA